MEIAVQILVTAGRGDRLAQSVSPITDGRTRAAEVRTATRSSAQPSAM
jgi:hypothetical protein